MDNPIVYFVFNLPLPFMVVACLCLLASTAYLSKYLEIMKWVIPLEIFLSLIYIASVVGWFGLDQIGNRGIVRFVLFFLFIILSIAFLSIAAFFRSLRKGSG